MIESNQDAAENAGLISEAISRTVSFIEKNGIDTYDPFDVFGTAYGQKVIKNRTALTFLGRIPLWLGMRHAPILIRRLLKTNKRPAAGGVANLASLYCQLGGEENLRKSRAKLEWLLRTATRAEGYIGWGFPYPWLHKSFLPAGTPIGHTTMTCGNAFFRYYEATGDDWAREPLILLSHFFDRGLKKTQRASGSISLSYTPTDQTQVINVQADNGSFLIRAGNRLGLPEYSELGKKAISCVLETQNPDGSWYYSTFDSVGKPTFIDNHHTGMVLSSLAEVHAECAPDDPLRKQIEPVAQAGASYFLNHLFTSEGLPKFYHDSVYPLDIYNFAQSIITLLDIRSIAQDDDALSRAVGDKLHLVVNQLFALMYKPGGGFLYRRNRFTRQNLCSLRWADALIAFALARYLQESTFSIPPHHASIDRAAKVTLP